MMMRTSRSTPRPPKRSDSRETVRAILVAAERLMAANEGELRMCDVGKLAGVASSTLYEYFPSKAALMFALEEAEWSRHITVLEEELKHVGGADLEETVRQMTSAVFDFVVSRGPIFALRDPESAQRFTSVIVDRIVGALELSLARHVSTHTVRPANVKLALQVLARLIPSMAWFGAREEGNEGLVAWRKEVVDLVVRYFVRDTMLETQIVPAA